MTLDLELTRKVLQAKALRRADPAGRWPSWLSGIESFVCADASWGYTVDPDGTVHIANVGAAPEGIGTWRLPLEYHDRP